MGREMNLPTVTQDAVLSNPSKAALPKRKDPLPAMLLALTVVTGVVDAVSFLGLGHVFTANMTGNIVFLGFAVAGAPGLSISRSLISIVAFLAGATIGGRLGAAMADSRRKAWLIAASLIESLLLFAAALASLGIERRIASVLLMFAGAAIGTLLLRLGLALPLFLSGACVLAVTIVYLIACR